MKSDPWRILARERLRNLDFSELQRAGLLPLDGQYFPSLVYPPKTSYPLMNGDRFLEGWRDHPSPLIVYAHIPFCSYRCRFCHYVIQLGASPEDKDRYLDALEHEMDLYLRRLSLDAFPAKSVSVGGGTATCLEPRQLERFLRSFCDRLDWQDGSQFTFDVDPTTLLGQEGAQRLKVLRSFGADRITIGTQSFDNGILARMNRAHEARDVVEAIAQARRAGFKSVAIDLIFGYPGQTLESWTKSMETCVSLDIESFQLYRLRIIASGLMPGSIAKQFAHGAAEFPSLEDALLMQQIGFLIAAQHGYSDRYTARLFSRQHDDVSKYMEAYCCELTDMLGFGISAFGNLDDRFGMNTSGGIKKYQSMVAEGQIPIERGMTRTWDDELRRRLIIPLKNGAVYKSSYRRMTGEALEIVFADKIRRLKEFHLVEEDGECLRLTERGRFFADEVCLQFYHPQYLPFPSSSYAQGPLNPHFGRPPVLSRKHTSAVR